MSPAETIFERHQPPIQVAATRKFRSTTSAHGSIPALDPRWVDEGAAVTLTDIEWAPDQSPIPLHPRLTLVLARPAVQRRVVGRLRLDGADVASWAAVGDTPARLGEVKGRVPALRARLAALRARAQVEQAVGIARGLELRRSAFDRVVGTARRCDAVAAQAAADAASAATTLDLAKQDHARALSRRQEAETMIAAAEARLAAGVGDPQVEQDQRLSPEEARELRAQMATVEAALSRAERQSVHGVDEAAAASELAYNRLRAAERERAVAWRGVVALAGDAASSAVALSDDEIARLRGCLEVLFQEAMAAAGDAAGAAAMALARVRRLRTDESQARPSLGLPLVVVGDSVTPPCEPVFSSLSTLAAERQVIVVTDNDAMARWVKGSDDHCAALVVVHPGRSSEPGTVSDPSLTQAPAGAPDLREASPV